MADPLTDALSVFVALCPHIRSTRDLVNAPHHFHREDGQVESASLTGDPVLDIRIVAERINALFEA